MKVHALCDRPSAGLAAALAEFETRFTYPLGPGRSFRISHGEDYPGFFRSMGSARCFVAEDGGRVFGAVGVAIRPIFLPDGTERFVAYVGDLKVDPAARGSLVFPRLAHAALAWARPQVSAAYGIVMDGTRASPGSYTGRVGIPSFMKIGTLTVLRFPCGTCGTDGPPVPLQIEHGRAAHATSATMQQPLQSSDRWLATPAVGQACYRALSRGRYASTDGSPQDRSTTVPQWLVHPDGLACGRLEDTRAAKQLFDSDGNEMLSAHLACFAWKTPHAAAELISIARQHAAGMRFPALFVAVSAEELDALKREMDLTNVVIAPATIHGVGLQSSHLWNINTSEI